MEGENLKNIASGRIYLKENSIKLVEPTKKKKSTNRFLKMSMLAEKEYLSKQP